MIRRFWFRPEVLATTLALDLPLAPMHEVQMGSTVQGGKTDEDDDNNSRT